MSGDGAGCGREIRPGDTVNITIGGATFPAKFVDARPISEVCPKCLGAKALDGDEGNAGGLRGCDECNGFGVANAYRLCDGCDGRGETSDPAGECSECGGKGYLP